MYFLSDVIFVMLHFIFSLCCITKSSPELQYLHFYVTPDVSISQNVNFFPLLLVVHTHLISLFQWLCHELCNLLLCTSFTAIMSWIQNDHSCPLFSQQCKKKGACLFLIIADINTKEQIHLAIFQTWAPTNISSTANLKFGAFIQC